jgi:hypothetical protein
MGGTEPHFVFKTKTSPAVTTVEITKGIILISNQIFGKIEKSGRKVLSF